MGLSKSGPRRSSQLHHIQRHQTLLQNRLQTRQEASTLKRWRQKTLSLPRAANAKRRPSSPLPREMTKPWNKRSRKARDSGPWLVSLCVLPSHVDQIPVRNIATHEIDERPVHDHKTGERLAPHSVRIDRRTECEYMNGQTSIVRTCAGLGCSGESQMSMVGRDERGTRWTVRVQQACCEGSGPRHPIRYIRRHGSSQMHEEYHLQGCVDQGEAHTLVHLTTNQSRCIRHVVNKKLDTCGKSSERCKGSRRASRLLARALEEIFGGAGMRRSKYVTKYVTALMRTQWCNPWGRHHRRRRPGCWARHRDPRPGTSLNPRDLNQNGS